MSKFFKLFTILTLFGLLLAPFGRVSAQESGPFEKKIPLRSTGYNPDLSQENTIPGASDVLAITGNLVHDPSFEASVGSQTFWGQASTNYGTPLCDAACGTGNGTAGPRTGNVWIWFGGVNFSAPGAISPEEGQVWQNVAFPSCGATLQFYFWIGQAPTGSDANDYFLAALDGTVIFSADATEASSYSSYTLVSLDVSSYADGAVHLLQFYSNTSGQIVNFNLDDISLIGNCPTISGNAGIAGATINYTGGSTSANGSGNYSFNVPAGWSGTVTPSLRCYTFSPASRSYNNLTTDQTAQNYAATVASTCAALTVRITGVVQGTRLIPRNAADRLSFPVDRGLVWVNSPNIVPFIASERVILPKGSNNPTHFTEMMGLPANLRSTRYSFPAYDNQFFSSQLRFSNVGTANTTVIVTIAGVERGRYNLAPNQSDRRSYPNLNDGPVVLQSTGNVPIIASLRVIPLTVNDSFSEIMGLPQSQVSTSYVFPWYNNVDLNTQVRVANVSGANTFVRLFIGSNEVTSGCTSQGQPLNFPFLLPNNASRRFSCAANNGPVRVVSTVGNIVASMRILFPKSGVAPFTGFSEIMGLAQNQLNSTYHFPWYNNVNLNTQLRVANMSGSTATVRVFIGGQEMVGSPFTLAARASTRKSFAISSGPVKVVSNQIIVASLRVMFTNGNTPTYFSELMGLPQSQLATGYFFPWYDNVGLDTQLRFGVP